MALQLKTLRKTLTKDEFVNRAFNKSKSFGSRAVVTSALLVFDEFCKEVYGKKPEAIIEELRPNYGDELYHFLQDFIDFMDSKKFKPSTLRAYFSFIRSYLRSQGIKIYSEDIRDLVRFPVIIKEMLEPLTKEQIRILLDNSKEDRKALYLTLISSGMRVSEGLSLLKKDFDFSKDPVTIRIQGMHTKTKQTRETFISSEAKELVMRIVKDKMDEDLVFGKSKDYRKALKVEEKVFENLRKRCKLNETYPNSSRHKITIHTMRAFFHTQASIVHDEQYANAMDGHQGYLMQYYRLSAEKRAELYKELEPNLMIYGTEEYAKNQQKLLEEVSTQRKEINELRQLVEILKNTVPTDFCNKMCHMSLYNSTPVERV